jgi:hypothetical protein
MVASPLDAALAALGLARDPAIELTAAPGPVAPLPELRVPGPMELWAFAAGVKPVVFLTVEPEREAAIVARCAGAHVERRPRRVEADARDRWTDDRSRGAPRVELYIARDPRLARRAAQLQADGDPTRDAVELGALLGYPRCCVDAFVAQPDRADNTRNRYLAAARTSAGAAPWPWPLNELHARMIPFYPCSYRCAAAVAFAEAALDALDAAHPGARAQVQAALARPVLYLDHGRQIWLTGEATIATTIAAARYRAVDVVGDDPATHALASVIAAGDRLALTADALAIHRGAAPIARFMRRDPGAGLLAPFGAP